MERSGVINSSKKGIISNATVSPFPCHYPEHFCSSEHYVSSMCSGNTRQLSCVWTDLMRQHFSIILRANRSLENLLDNHCKHNLEVEKNFWDFEIIKGTSKYILKFILFLLPLIRYLFPKNNPKVKKIQISTANCMKKNYRTWSNRCKFLFRFCERLAQGNLPKNVKLKINSKLNKNKAKSWWHNSDKQILCGQKDTFFNQKSAKT